MISTFQPGGALGIELSVLAGGASNARLHDVQYSLASRIRLAHSQVSPPQAPILPPLDLYAVTALYSGRGGAGAWILFR